MVQDWYANGEGVVTLVVCVWCRSLREMVHKRCSNGIFEHVKRFAKGARRVYGVFTVGGGNVHMWCSKGCGNGALAVQER